jgi:hypothetical protein
MSPTYILISGGYKLKFFSLVVTMLSSNADLVHGQSHRFPSYLVVKVDHVLR